MEEYGISHRKPEKFKSSKIPATLLKIGAWQRQSIHAEDLVAKYYYGKKKIVWEILEGGLKSKIEFKWSDIVAIKAIHFEDQSGILEIQLNEPPLFFRETNPLPQRHTIWKEASDFTGGEALKCREHYALFPPGHFHTHFQKLMQSDSRLFELSKKPFPLRSSPYFYSTACGVSDVTCGDFNQQPISQAPSMPQYLYSAIPPSSLVSSLPVDTVPPPSLVSSLPVDIIPPSSLVSPLPMQNLYPSLPGDIIPLPSLVSPLPVQNLYPSGIDGGFSCQGNQISTWTSSPTSFGNAVFDGQQNQNFTRTFSSVSPTTQENDAYSSHEYLTPDYAIPEIACLQSLTIDSIQNYLLGDSQYQNLDYGHGEFRDDDSILGVREPTLNSMTWRYVTSSHLF
ncbi:hypothetical protein NMG60_11015346 [Bertholletia excelsa]